MYKTDARHANPDLERKLQHLYTLHKSKTVDLSFRSPYLNLLTRLGNPHLHLPPVIHVAGTNGKGSVIAFMRAMLEAAGHTVHVYTSPHLVRFNERIVVASREIDDATLEALLDEAVTLNAGGELTFFEITTAMAFAAFARHKADIVLLETGLGGRLDCTNVIEDPAATVIMPIGYDHMEFLGNTIESIATEKGGIMKPGAPCIVAPQVHDTVNDTLARIAQGKGVALLPHGMDWRIEAGTPNHRTVHIKNRAIPFPDPSLPGKHQIFNAGTAIRVLDVLKDFPLSQAQIAQGLTHAVWPGRLQKLSSFGGKPLPSGIELWLDGAHNEAAATVLADQLRHWQATDGQPIHLVVGMLNKRDPVSFLKPLLPHIQSLTVTAIPDESGSHKPEALRQSAMDCGWPFERIYMINNPIEGVDQIIHSKRGRIIVAGSLYMIGSLLQSAIQI